MLGKDMNVLNEQNYNIKIHVYSWEKTNKEVI